MEEFMQSYAHIAELRQWMCGTTDEVYDFSAQRIIDEVKCKEEFYVQKYYSHEEITANTGT